MNLFLLLFTWNTSTFQPWGVLLSKASRLWKSLYVLNEMSLYFMDYFHVYWPVAFLLRCIYKPDLARTCLNIHQAPFSGLSMVMLEIWLIIFPVINISSVHGLVQDSWIVNVLEICFSRKNLIVLIVILTGRSSQRLMWLLDFMFCSDQVSIWSSESFCTYLCLSYKLSIYTFCQAFSTVIVCKFHIYVRVKREMDSGFNNSSCILTRTHPVFHTLNLRLAIIPRKTSEVLPICAFWCSSLFLKHKG